MAIAAVPILTRDRNQLMDQATSIENALNQPDDNDQRHSHQSQKSRHPNSSFKLTYTSAEFRGLRENDKSKPNVDNPKGTPTCKYCKKYDQTIDEYRKKKAQ